MDNYVIIACIKTEPTCKLINRIPGLLLLISSLPGLALRTHVKSLGKPCNSTSVLEALPGKLDIRRHSSSIPNIQQSSQVGFTEVGQLNAIKMTYYGDCGMNPNDNSLPPMQVWADNGKILEYFQAFS